MTSTAAPSSPAKKGVWASSKESTIGEVTIPGNRDFEVVVRGDSWHSGSDPRCLISGRGMSFDVGDKVVYPHHGAAIIERREKRNVFGENREYLVLKLAYGDLTLMVPCDNTEEVGLREVINDEEVEEVFAVLRKKEARMPTNWSRRFKNHVEKLKSGDIYQVAEVVRNLSIRDKDKGLSAGEKRMLNRARQILVSELTFAIGVSEEEAEKKLNEALP